MAIAMTSPAPFFRTFSNKENATFAPSALRSSASSSTTSISTSRKPRIGGIGKAPKHTSTGSHSSKPYDRRSSVARAKARATSPTKSVSVPQESTHIRSRRRAAPPAPISIPTASTSATSLPQSLPPSAIQMKAIPLRLPRPQIPPIVAVPGGMEHVPVNWAVPRAKALFHDLLVVSSHYRPVPQFTRPASSTDQQTFAFAIPGASSSSVDVEAKIRGRLPDLCLAVKGKGEETKPARLVPTSSVVYASQCSYWPRNLPITTASTSAADEADDTLTTIKEEVEEVTEESDDSEITTRPLSPGSSTEIDSNSNSASSPRCSTTPNDPPTLVHLPLLSISIPHAASFPLIHTHLHLPNYPLIQALLSLSLDSRPQEAIPQLRKMSTRDLMGKLGFLHGFWANLCALGIAGDRSWQALGQAWGVVTSIIAERSRRVAGDVKRE